MGARNANQRSVVGYICLLEPERQMTNVFRSPNTLWRVAFLGVPWFPRPLARKRQ